MKKIPIEIVEFVNGQEFAITSTLDSDGAIHSVAKGIVGVEEKGKVYLIDVYKEITFNNLRANPLISITVIDAHVFKGYTLKGKAKIIEKAQIKNHIIGEWMDRVLNRISKRVIKNVKQDKSSSVHPEARFPGPQYLIDMDVEQIVDLTPAALKHSAK